MRHKIYLAIKMRGEPHLNFHNLDAAAEQVRKLGHIPLNPADLDRSLGLTGEEHAVDQATLRRVVARDFAVLCMEATAILMLPSWEDSGLAPLEHAVAIQIGLAVFYAIEDVPCVATVEAN